MGKPTSPENTVLSGILKVGTLPEYPDDLFRDRRDEFLANLHIGKKTVIKSM